MWNKMKGIEMESNVAAAQAGYDSVAANLAALSENRNLVRSRRSELDSQRRAMAEERMSASLKGEGFAKTADLRDILDQMEGFREADESLSQQIAELRLTADRWQSKLSELKTVAGMEGEIAAAVSHVAAAEKNFLAGIKAINGFHGVAERLQVSANSLGVNDAFVHERLRNRLGERLARLFTNQLGGELYGAVIYRPNGPAEGIQDWVAGEQDMLERELGGVVNMIRIRERDAGRNED